MLDVRHLACKMPDIMRGRAGRFIELKPPDDYNAGRSVPGGKITDSCATSERGNRWFLPY